MTARIHQVSLKNVSGVNKLARFSNGTHFVWSSSMPDREVWTAFVEGKGQSCSIIAIVASIGGLLKRIHANLGWSP